MMISLSMLTFTDPILYFKNKRCDKENITKLNDAFLQPGLFNVNATLENSRDIIACAGE